MSLVAIFWTNLLFYEISSLYIYMSRRSSSCIEQKEIDLCLLQSVFSLLEQAFFWLPQATSALTDFHASSQSRWNWNLKMSSEKGKNGKPSEKTLAARRKPTTNSIHIRHQTGIEPGPQWGKTSTLTTTISATLSLLKLNLPKNTLSTTCTWFCSLFIFGLLSSLHQFRCRRDIIIVVRIF